MKLKNDSVNARILRAYARVMPASPKAKPSLYRLEGTEAE